MTATTYGLFAGALSFFDFAVMVAFLVISLTVVRTKRPDAFLPIALAAGLFVVNIVLRNILNFGMSMIVDRTGGDMYTSIAATTTLTFLVSMVAWITLLIGIVKLAGDPPGSGPPGAPPPMHIPPGGY